jgi:O-antigen/teichoic acid export membrane protein
VIVSVLALLILWLLYFGGFSFKGLMTLPNLVLISFIILSDRLNAYSHNYVKGYGLFDAIGINSFIASIIGPIITLPLVVWMHVTGALLAQLLVTLLAGANYLRYMIRHTSFQFRLTLPLTKTLELIKLGLLLYANNLSEGLLEIIAITLLAFFLAVDQVGQFSYAISMAAFGLAITTGVNVVLYRRMLLEWGEQGTDTDYAHFRHYMDRVLVLYLLFVSGASGLAYFGHEVVVRLFIPQFSQAILLAQIVIFAQMITGVVLFFRLYHNATDQLVRRLVLALVGLLIHCIFVLFFLKFGYGALGVVFGMASGNALFALVLMVASAKQIYGRLSVGMALLGRLFIISLLLTFSLHLLTSWQPVFPFELSSIFQWLFEFLMAGTRLAIYSALVALLYSLFFRRHRPEREIQTLLVHIISSIKHTFQKRTGYVHQ